MTANSQGISRKELIFPDNLQARLHLISEAVLPEHFDQVVAELARHGMRSSVTALLYGPPGKAADKEENTTANIILEELNTFNGILLAATNNIANLDPAMNRRFLLKAEIPVPSIPTLARIWQSKLPWLNPDEADTLAERFPISGGVIDNVVSQ